MADARQKKYNLRKIFNQFVEISLDEDTTIIHQDSTEDKAERLYSYQETLKKNIAAIKTLDEEIIDLKNDPAIRNNYY